MNKQNKGRDYNVWPTAICTVYFDGKYRKRVWNNATFLNLWKLLMILTSNKFNEELEKNNLKQEQNLKKKNNRVITLR